MTVIPSNMNHHAELLEKLRSRQALIGIVGLGYVGLPLSLTYAEAAIGFWVLILIAADAINKARATSTTSMVASIRPSKSKGLGPPLIFPVLQKLMR